MEKITMEPIIVEMSYASTGRVIDFYEDFYAVTIVSYIYYEQDQQDLNARLIAPETIDRDLLIIDQDRREALFADPRNPF